VLDRREEFRAGVKNAGLEVRFNDVHLPQVVVSTEDWLAEEENKTAPLLRRIAADPSQITATTESEQMQLARFFAALRFRVPAFREWLIRLQASLAAQIKPFGKEYLDRTYEADTAAQMWAEWQDKPDEWWLREEGPVDTSLLTASQLSEVQGYANLFWAMPWRVGKVPSHLRLYTSDNPVEGIPRPLGSWWDRGAFTSLTYYIPLSPSVLLTIYPLDSQQERAVGVPGDRVHKDFSGWHVGMALQVISAQATRFLYGEGPVIERDIARRDLSLRQQQTVEIARRCFGYSDDPYGPSSP
jgi:hypothetical protein